MTAWQSEEENESVQHLREILRTNGIKDHEVLENTPRRWVKALRAQLGHKAEEFEFTTFASKANDMVIVQDIQFSSLCAHHLLPFFGLAHVAYIPQGRIVGLSKLARVVRSESLGLWTQEELTEAISKRIHNGLKSGPMEDGLGGMRYADPKGVAVILQAEHTCMTVRGVKAPGAKTTTSSMMGVFLNNLNNARAEFLSLIK